MSPTCHMRLPSSLRPLFQGALSCTSMRSAISHADSYSQMVDQRVDACQRRSDLMTRIHNSIDAAYITLRTLSRISA
jgi:hypothetical protein